MGKYEKFGLNAVARLADSIDNLVTTIEVTTTERFPTDGNFRVTLGVEIMIVTAVSGNTFTVRRGEEGTSAVAHDAGSPVVQTLTDGALNALGLENVPLWRESSRPSMRLLDSAGATLTQSSFTAVNSAVGVDLDSGAIQMTIPATVSQNTRVLTKAAPTAPYIVTAAFVPQLHNALSPNYVGIGFRRSASSRIVLIVTAIGIALLGPPVATQGSGNIAVFNFANSTTFSGALLSRRDWWMGRELQWFQIENDNVNLYFRTSMDGFNWQTVYQEGVTNTFAAAPNEVCWGGNSGTDNDFASGLNLVAWEEA